MNCTVPKKSSLAGILQNLVWQQRVATLNYKVTAMHGAQKTARKNQFWQLEVCKPSLVLSRHHIVRPKNIVLVQN